MSCRRHRGLKEVFSPPKVGELIALTYANEDDPVEGKTARREKTVEEVRSV